MNDGSPGKARNLDIVAAEGERLTALINDLLYLAKIESGKVEWRMEEVRPAELIRRAASATAGLFEQKPQLELETEIPDGLPAFTGDPDRLLQVLINLLSNSVKFTEKGFVRLGVSMETQESGKNLLFFMEDTGSGIPTDQLDHIFEKFRQVEDQQTGKPKGAGLGLPICKEIVEHHQGRIWVERKLRLSRRIESGCRTKNLGVG